MSSLDGTHGPTLDFTLGPFSPEGALSVSPRFWPQFPHVSQVRQLNGPERFRGPRSGRARGSPLGPLGKCRQLAAPV